MKHITALSGLLAIPVVDCQSLDAPYDSVISECPFSENLEEFVSNNNDAPGWGGVNYARNCDYDDFKLFQWVIVFDTEPEASAYFQLSNIVDDSSDWLEHENLLYQISDIAPPNTDQWYRYFSPPDPDEYEIAPEYYGVSEGVRSRVGRYIGLAICRGPEMSKPCTPTPQVGAPCLVAC